MSIRKNTIWTVPLFCIAAGVIAFFLIAYGFGRFAIVTLPDGTLASDTRRVLLLYGFVLAASLIIGGMRLFSRMTRAEIALSATIVAVFQLIITLIVQFVPLSGTVATTFSYLGMISEWSSFIPLLVLELTGNVFFSALVGVFTPYLFVPFGKKTFLTD